MGAHVHDVAQSACHGINGSMPEKRRAVGRQQLLEVFQKEKEILGLNIYPGNGFHICVCSLLFGREPVLLEVTSSVGKSGFRLKMLPLMLAQLQPLYSLSLTL